MNKLASYRKNPFLSIDISRPRFGAFVFDHIKRTKAANNINFAPLILSTETLYNSIFDTIEKSDEFKNEKLSLTKQVKIKIREFKAEVLRMESLVIVKFEKKSPIYKKFYPHGRTEYHRGNKSNILFLFDRIVNATTIYEAELGNDWKTAFTQMYNDFLPLFDQQVGSKGAVANSASEFKIQKLALCHQLYKNLLVILAEYYENPKKAKAFFDEKIVNWKKHKKKKMNAPKTEAATENKG